MRIATCVSCLLIGLTLAGTAFADHASGQTIGRPRITFDSAAAPGQGLYSTQGVHFNASDGYWAVSAEALSISYDGVTSIPLTNGTVDLRGAFVDASSAGDQEPTGLRDALLFTTEGALRVDHIAWCITEDNRLVVCQFAGWDQGGRHVAMAQPRELGQRVTSLRDLGGFVLGMPSNPDAQVWVDAMSIGTDVDGYICATALVGRMLESGRPVQFSLDAANGCSLLLVPTCLVSGCNSCSPPACQCSGPPGAFCVPATLTLCRGACPRGYRCGTPQDCKCVRVPPEPRGRRDQ